MNDMAAYWLGFLHADGYLMESPKRGGSRRIYLELAYGDRKHIDRFLRDFGESRISRKRTKTLEGKKHESARTTISINKLGFINISDWCDFKHGDPCCLERLEDRLLMQWLRGFVDGDGTVKFKKYNRHRPVAPVLIIVSPHNDILEYLNNRIETITGVRANTVKNNTESLRKIQWVGTHARDILRKIYNNNCRCLYRKYKEFLVCDRYASFFERAA